MNRDDEGNSKWVKLGSEGWVMTRHINDIFNEMVNQRTMARKDSQFFQRLTEKKIRYYRQLQPVPTINDQVNR